MRDAATLDARWARNFKASQSRQALKARAVSHLGGSCRICGYDKCLSALEFHHLDPNSKDFVIASKASWEGICKELDKCVLLCCRCHRETHAGYHPQYTLTDGDLD